MVHHQVNVLGQILLVQCQGPIFSALHKCDYIADYSKGISDNACSRIYVMHSLFLYGHAHECSLNDRKYNTVIKYYLSLDAQSNARPFNPITPIKNIMWSHI